MSSSSERHAMVIGAGLAGAAACVALARRGWRITLIDAEPGCARAASSLPVGMLSPYVTRAPTALSRLCEQGVPDTRAELRRIVLPGEGWQACELDDLGPDPKRWSATLVRPAALVAAWLQEARTLTALTCRYHTLVQRLDLNTEGEWMAINSLGDVVARARTVVVASAYDSLRLLCESALGLDTTALPLRPVKGQMSLGALDTVPMAARPCRENGVYVPDYQDSGLPPQWPDRIWAMGSTYERDEDSTHLSEAAHKRNADSLSQLSPAAAQRMRSSTEDRSLLGWAQVRCASLDRLPLVGGVPNVAALRDRLAQSGPKRGRLPLAEVPRWRGLFTLTALGSRGITLAHGMGSLLAQLIEQEAPTLTADLVNAVDPARFAWRQSRREPLPPLSA